MYKVDLKQLIYGEKLGHGLNCIDDIQGTFQINQQISLAADFHFETDEVIDKPMVQAILIGEIDMCFICALSLCSASSWVRTFASLASRSRVSCRAASRVTASASRAACTPDDSVVMRRRAASKPAKNSSEDRLATHNGQ